MVEDEAHDGADAVHGPPGVKRAMQPVLDRLGLDLVQAQLAPARRDLLVQVKPLLHMRGLGDLVSAAEIAFFIHLGNFPNKATPVVATLSTAASTIGTVEFPSPSDGGELASPPLRLRRVGAR